MILNYNHNNNNDDDDNNKNIYSYDQRSNQVINEEEVVIIHSHDAMMTGEINEDIDYIASKST